MTHTRTSKIRQKEKKRKKKRFKTPQNKGNTYQEFGGKPSCHVTIIGSGCGFPNRRISKFCHSFSSSHCVATVTFCLHVSEPRLWRWSKQSQIGAWGDERVKLTTANVPERERTWTFLFTCSAGFPLPLSHAVPSSTYLTSYLILPLVIPLILLALM